ncbi:non-homologous end joining protein Ku [Ramlibacter sp. PS4R-6]|uniref:non-homologous end joining protein Ku n=1 Tax=Ramlibacter sp. PS4R-6 TaxID=3133438 RepID=UPI003098905C
MAPSSTRTLWKGAISFGLVHIPVSLHSATAEHRMKFKLLDKDTMNPVGNRQVNKSSGEAMAKDDIVKGFEYEKDQYVTVSPDEIKAALPKSTQTIDIEAFVDGSQISTVYYNKPYYVAPAAKGQKPYKLLLETMKRTGKVGIARVVISTRQHLAALIPAGDGLVLELLRWHDEVRDTAGLSMPDKDTKITDKEIRMAQQLVGELEGDFEPQAFHDDFREKLQQLVDAKVKAGQGEHIVKPLEGEEIQGSADIVDLTELLRRSLRKGGGAANDEPEEAPARKTASRRKAANDEEAQPRKAAARKGGARAATSTAVKSRSTRKKAA